MLKFKGHEIHMTLFGKSEINVIIEIAHGYYYYPIPFKNK